MPELQYIEVSKIFPHPDNPRKNLGDIQELSDSIKANGVLQNLTVVPMSNGRYTVVIGHRRLAAAKKAGLPKVPCVVTEMTPQEQVRTMLMENIQRSDLTVYEQAQGFQMMLDMGETVETIAKDCGFSQATVRRRVKLLDLDAEKFRKSEARGATLQDYMELDKIEDSGLKNKVLDSIGTANFRAELKSAIDTDRQKKRVAAWLLDLEAFATKIEKQGYIGEERHPMDYVTNFGRWSPADKTVERPADLDTVSYFYLVSDLQIDLYRDKQPAPEPTEEELRQKTLREEAEARGAELKEIKERHFSLRSDFISEFGAAKKHMAEILWLAADAITGTGAWGRDEVNAELLARLLDFDIDENTDYDEFKRLVRESAGDSTPEYFLLACAYAAFDNEDLGYFRNKWNSEKRIYENVYEPNSTLDALYDFLVSLGYEMSDEEKAMREGTHRLLNRANL